MEGFLLQVKVGKGNRKNGRGRNWPLVTGVAEGKKGERGRESRAGVGVG